MGRARTSGACGGPGRSRGERCRGWGPPPQLPSFSELCLPPPGVYLGGGTKALKVAFFLLALAFNRVKGEALPSRPPQYAGQETYIH